MAFRLDDRWLWLGVGATLFLAIRGIQYAIRDTTNLTEVKVNDVSRPKKDDPHPEDSISLETLHLLINSPNTRIANAATSQVVMRFLRQTDAQEQLTADMASPDPDVRGRAHMATFFLTQYPLPPGAMSAPLSGAGTVNRSHSLQSTDAVQDLPYSWSSQPVGSSVQGQEGASTTESRFSMGEGEAEGSSTRRQRREAMVLHEGAGALSVDDILQASRSM